MHDICLYVCVATGSRPKLKHLLLIKWESEGAEHSYRLVNNVSSKWQKFGLMIDLTKNQMKNWAKETDNEECWERVMEAWLEGQGQDEYPLTWEGLFKLLKDVEFQGVVPALKRAVESAASQGTYIIMCIMQYWWDVCPDKVGGLIHLEPVQSRVQFH